MGLTQVSFAEHFGISQSVVSALEKNDMAPPYELVHGLLCNHPEVDLRYLFCGKPALTTSFPVDAIEVAANIRPIIRLVGDRLNDLPPEGIADDYLAVPLLDGKAAAGPGGVVWERVKSMVWVYRPEIGRSKQLIAVKVAGTSMQPTIPSGAIIIIDRNQREPRFQRRDIWALRSQDGDTQIKRLLAVNDEIILLMSDNPEYAPEKAWTGDLRRLVIGKVVWMWRSL